MAVSAPLYLSVPDYTPKKSHCIHKSLKYTLLNNTNIIVYIWHRNRHEFWFYITEIRGYNLYGFGYNGNEWLYGRINLRDVEVYY